MSDTTRELFELRNGLRNYFIEMLRYCELVINNVKKYLN